jgi:hypothetical protein
MFFTPVAVLVVNDTIPTWRRQPSSRQAFSAFGVFGEGVLSHHHAANIVTAVRILFS